MPPNQEQQDSSTTKGSNAALHAADKHISTGGHARAHDISDSFHRLPLLGRLRILDSMAVHMLPLTLEVQAELEAEKVARSTQDAEEQVNALLKRAQAGDNAVDGNTGTSTQRRESLAVKGPELLRRQSSFDSAVPDASTNGFAGIQSSGKVGVTLHGGVSAFVRRDNIYLRVPPLCLTHLIVWKLLARLISWTVLLFSRCTVSLRSRGLPKEP